MPDEASIPGAVGYRVLDGAVLPLGAAPKAL